MGRAPCCDKAKVKRGTWSPEEDAKLKSFIEQHGTGGNWIALPQKIGLQRCGKSCRLRWLNYLRPNIKHGGFSEEEDRIIWSLFISIGSRWSIIAAQLPGRTDNDIKNYWNTRLRKKLLGKRKEQHHRRIKKEVTWRNETEKIIADAQQKPNLAVRYSCNDQSHSGNVSIRKLLMSLGGRLFNNHQPNECINLLQGGVDVLTTTHQLYSTCGTINDAEAELPVHSENSINGFTSSSSITPVNGSCKSLHQGEEPSLFHGSPGFRLEFNDLVSCNTQGLDGLGCSYGEQTNNRNAWADDAFSGSCPLMCPSLVSQFASYQQGVLQEIVFRPEFQ